MYANAYVYVHVYIYVCVYVYVYIHTRTVHRGLLQFAPQLLLNLLLSYIEVHLPHLYIFKPTVYLPSCIAAHLLSPVCHTCVHQGNGEGHTTVYGYTIASLMLLSTCVTAITGARSTLLLLR